MDELPTTSLRDRIARFQAGQTSALDSLIRRTQERLEHFTRRMLGGFPGVGAREQVEDVVQNVLIRLTRALRQEVPPSVEDFFGLTALHIRRESLDLARSHARRPAAHLAQDPPERDGDSSAEWDRWAALHEAAGRLPDQLRQVFSYTFYHGWTQNQIAELLGLSDRQVRRRWVEACLRLKAAVGNLPAS
jgi:RNA polymerase sigma factor (sigma-70 family)